MKFSRQIAIHEIGPEGQEKLKKSRVVVVGAGGLGCPVLTYLASSGVGTITVIDYDTINESNLNRQFLYSPTDIGKNKAECACEKLSHTHADSTFIAINEKLDSKNIAQIIDTAAVIIDCVDTVASRLLVNDYAVKNDIPLVEGGVNGFYGFVTTIKDSACLRCWNFEQTKEETAIPSLGGVCGIIGSVQSVEAIKILLGLDDLLTNKLLQYDGLNGDFDEIIVKKQSICTCN